MMHINKLQTKLVNLHNVTMDFALSNIRDLSKSKELDTIITPNIDHLVRICENDPDGTLKKIYNDAALCLCDSKILEKLLKAKGKDVIEVIPGSTLTQNLFDEIITEKDTVFVVGGNDNTIEKLRSLYPHFTILHHNPPMGFIHDVNAVNMVIELIEKQKPNYIFLAVGSPRQEILADMLRAKKVSSGVILCIGASILFIVGDERRAPLILQNLHLEWFYRLIRDPKRLASRYIKNIIALPKLFSNL